MGDKKAKTNVKNKDPELVGWSKKEKFDLMQGIKASGSHNITAIHKTIPTKTREQIKTAIEHYKTIACRHRSLAKTKGGRPRTDVNLKPSLPLSQWAKLLTDNVKYEGLQTEIATALRLIAEFEVMPDSLCTDFVDFRRAYHALADAVEGKNVPDDPFLSMLITKSIVETALTSKVFLQNTTLKQIVENIEIKGEQDVKYLNRPISNKELGIVQHFADQRNYNPLNISEENLRAKSE